MFFLMKDGVRNLVSSLSRDNDVELVDAMLVCSEASSVWFIGITDVRNDSVEHDVCMLRHWTEVLRQPDIECYVPIC